MCATLHPTRIANITIVTSIHLEDKNLKILENALVVPDLPFYMDIQSDMHLTVIDIASLIQYVTTATVM